jgi:alpha-L-arabinofuranosidase
VIQASHQGLFVTQTYLVNELYSRRIGQQRLAARVESTVFDTSREGKGVPYLDVVVSCTADRQQIFIKAVNTDAHRALRTSVRVQGVPGISQAVMETLNGDSLESANSFATPDAVSLKKKNIEAGTNFVVDFPQHSVSVITLSVAP